MASGSRSWALQICSLTAISSRTRLRKRRYSAICALARSTAGPWGITWVTVFPPTRWVSEYDGPCPRESFWAQWQLGLPHLRKRVVKKPGRKSSIWAKRAVIRARLSRSAFKAVVMGASYLTGTIACQIGKENPTQTLSDFDPDSYVVHPQHPAISQGRPGFQPEDVET